jgi:hypothetical protein
MDRLGITYWRRTCQLPAVTVCVKHGTSLAEATIPFRMRQQYFLTSKSLSSPAFQSTKLESHCSELAFQLAIFSCDILHSKFTSHPHTVVAGAVQDGLAQLGLVSSQGNLKSNLIIEQFTNFYKDLVNTTEFGPFLTPQSCKRLVAALNTRNQVIPSTVAVMLGYWLFRSWNFFAAQCQWRSVLESGNAIDQIGRKKPTEITSDSVLASTQNSHRQTCISFLLGEPSATRSVFWRKHQKSCRWLAQHDKTWLDTQLPGEPEPRSKQIQLFP